MELRNPTITAYASSLGLSAVSLTVNELVALGGLVLAILTFVVNLVYKHLHYRLAAAKANAAVPEEVSDVSEG